MNCLFKTDPKKAKIPLLNRIPLKTIYFSHSNISDLKNKKYYPDIDYLSFVSRDSFTKPLLFVNYTEPIMLGTYFNSAICETKKFQYQIKTENLDLTLESVKKPLLLNKNGYLDLSGRRTYYYSLTNLKTKGEIKVKNKVIPVSGKAWMDHQWANVSYAKDKWTWFSIQLDNNLEIVCFEYTNQGKKTYLASLSYPDNKQTHTEEVFIIPSSKKWLSQRTKAKYHLDWKILIPSQCIILNVSPYIRNQEMIFGKINYWEGPLKVNGRIKSKTVKGQGFMELVGRQARFSDVKILHDTFVKNMKNIYTELKKIK